MYTPAEESRAGRPVMAFGRNKGRAALSFSRHPDRPALIRDGRIPIHTVNTIILYSFMTVKGNSAAVELHNRLDISVW